ncbi:MAG: helix-turn-helix transcriptional regulator [Planctomycetota bacterium]|jgi:PAS domain S-box-containing protein
MGSILGLFRNAADGACAVSREQRVILWNRSAEAILGFESAEVLGRGCHEVLRASDEHDQPVCGRNCPIFRMAGLAQSAPTGVMRVRRKDGERLWLSMSTLAIPPRFQSEAALVHLFRDISQLKMCAAAVDHLLAQVSGRFPEPGAAAPAPFSPPNPTACLTPREHEVLALIAAGQSTREIADALYVSPSTVRNHVHNILAKLGVHSRLEAVTTALRFGVL